MTRSPPRSTSTEAVAGSTRTNSLRDRVVGPFEHARDLLPRPRLGRGREGRDHLGRERVLLVHDLGQPFVPGDLRLEPGHGRDLLPADPLLARERLLFRHDRRRRGERVELLEALVERGAFAVHRHAREPDRPGALSAEDRGRALDHLADERLERGVDRGRVDALRGGRTVDPGADADLLGERPAEPEPGREGPDQVPVRLREQGRERGRIGDRPGPVLQRVLGAGHDLAVPEPVVPERLDDHPVRVAEDHVPLVEELEDEVVARILPPDLERDDPLEPVLLDREDAPALEVFAEQHRERRRQLRGLGGRPDAVEPPARLGEEVVPRVLLAVQPDPEQLLVVLVDLPDPERHGPPQVRDHGQQVHAAHPLCGRH